MLLKLENPKLFSDLIGIISGLVTEVRLKVTKEGVHLTAIDPANVAMVYFKMPADLFAQYDLQKDEILGVNLDNLTAVLKRCKPGSSLTLMKEDNALHIGIHDRIKRDFTLALLDIDAEEKEMPQWEFKSVIKMDADVFAEVVEDCLVVADACTFFAEPTKFIVEAHGLNSARAEFSTDEVEIYSDKSKARFSLEYLNKFVKGGRVSNRVTLSFSEDHPMRIDFPTGNVMLSFVLAPRIEQD
ncbi:MAG TPA: proliferating cell nuclear antigen (pcna) [Candidatus Nanoarchaeia archaeon]|nr:proliferating cell nuclear antigen (pcna) [Candidatus Nanoarchaeia archaeon]